MESAVGDAKGMEEKKKKAETALHTADDEVDKMFKTLEDKVRKILKTTKKDIAPAADSGGGIKSLLANEITTTYNKSSDGILDITKHAEDIKQAFGRFSESAEMSEPNIMEDFDNQKKPSGASEKTRNMAALQKDMSEATLDFVDRIEDGTKKVLQDLKELENVTKIGLAIISLKLINLKFVHADNGSKDSKDAGQIKVVDPGRPSKDDSKRNGKKKDDRPKDAGKKDDSKKGAVVTDPGRPSKDDIPKDAGKKDDSKKGAVVTDPGRPSKDDRAKDAGKKDDSKKNVVITDHDYKPKDDGKKDNDKKDVKEKDGTQKKHDTEKSKSSSLYNQTTDVSSGKPAEGKEKSDKEENTFTNAEDTYEP